MRARVRTRAPMGWRELSRAERQHWRSGPGAEVRARFARRARQAPPLVAPPEGMVRPEGNPHPARGTARRPPFRPLRAPHTANRHGRMPPPAHNAHRLPPLKARAHSLARDAAPRSAAPRRGRGAPHAPSSATEGQCECARCGHRPLPPPDPSLPPPPPHAARNTLPPRQRPPSPALRAHPPPRPSPLARPGARRERLPPLTPPLSASLFDARSCRPAVPVPPSSHGRAQWRLPPPPPPCSPLPPPARQRRRQRCVRNDIPMIFRRMPTGALSPCPAPTLTFREGRRGRRRCAGRVGSAVLAGRDRVVLRVRRSQRKNQRI